MTRKRLLVLTSRFPFPVLGGDRLRIYQLCRCLASRFDLTLLSLCGSDAEMRMDVSRDSVFARVERVYHGWTHKGIGLLSALSTGNPLQIGFYRNSEFARRVDCLAPLHDGVLGHLVRTAPYLCRSSLPKFLEMTDAISMAYTRGGTLSRVNRMRSFILRVEAHRLERFERQIIRAVDRTILVSEIDREYLGGAGEEHGVMVCSNGVDTDALPFQFAQEGCTVIFIGKNTAYHNADAILYFSTEILPLVRQRFPHVRFLVLGPIGSHLRRVLRTVPGVEVSGAVASIPAAARGAVIGVCPVRFGAGIQNKILEYMALGIPVVTSEIGREGLDATVGEHLLVANTSGEWYEMICMLLEQPQLRLRLAHAGRDYVENHHSWNVLIEPLANEIDQVLTTRKRIDAETDNR